GRVVYGGGGIQPDVEVGPLALTRLGQVLEASGAFTAFATEYLASHSPLPATFRVTPDIIDEFKVFLSGRQIQPGVSEWSAERNWVSHRLEEEIVMQSEGVAKGDEVEAKYDPQVQAAIKAMYSKSLLASVSGRQ
ncbi:MAG: hypothetical protein JO108_35530, partial [Acidobacteriaceae bacterium]|nr:hypothetical protein [Acidobacteriaceae bacterium]